MDRCNMTFNDLTARVKNIELCEKKYIHWEPNGEVLVS